MKSLGVLGQDYLSLVDRLAEERREFIEAKCEDMTAKEFVTREYGAAVADLFPDDFGIDDLIGTVSTPMLTEARDRLRLCSRCPSHGGACDLSHVPRESRGRVPEWDREQGLRFEWCERWPEHLTRRRLRAVGVGERFLAARFSTYEPNSDVQRGALRLCIEYAMNFGVTSETPNLLIAGGDAGVGKTHLAVSVLAGCIAARKIRSAYFVYVPEFLERIRRSFDTKEPQDILVRASETDLLVLDDLCAQRTTDWVQEQMNVLSNARWSAGKPTIITTNINPEDIGATLGPRAESRFFGNVTGVMVAGIDRREVQRDDG